MDLVFIRKISFALLVIGVVAICFNIVFMIFAGQATAITYFAVTQIIICGAVMLYGYLKPEMWVAHFQAWGAWLVAILALLDSPVNIAGIFFAIISYLLFVEYGIIKSVFEKTFFISIFFVPIVISIFIFKKDCSDLASTYLLTSLFCFFLYSFFQHRQKIDSDYYKKEYEDIKAKYDRCIKNISKIECLTTESIDIAKNQLQIINELTKEIENYKNQSMVI